MARMDWDRVRREGRTYRPVEMELVPIPCDASFWACWHDAKAEMRIAGYSVRKIDGRWCAYLRRQAGRSGAPSHDVLRKQAEAVRRKAELYRQYRRSDAYRERIPFREWLSCGGNKHAE